MSLAKGKSMQVRVKVQTGVRKEMMTVVNDTVFTIKVSEAAERNLANRRVKALLAEYFEVEPSCVRLISGHHTPQKIYDIIGA